SSAEPGGPDEHPQECPFDALRSRADPRRATSTGKGWLQPECGARQRTPHSLQIRPSLPGDPLGLLAPPFLDSAVIARQERVRYDPPLPFARPRVVGIFEQPAFEA